MNVLVTGGAGYIGSHTAVELINAGHEAIIVDDLSNAKAEVIDRIETITGKRPVAEAIVTSGGIKVSEIDPKTMESKRVPGLYFAGEIIDCDAYTGGFNLQIAWATAYAAGMAVKRH